MDYLAPNKEDFMDDQDEGEYFSDEENRGSTGVNEAGLDSAQKD